MIFIGEGALLTRALRFAGSRGLSVDGIVTPAALPRATSAQLKCPVEVTADPNGAVEFVRANAKDGIVWSINNKRILRGELLALPGVRYFNIHNGPVQTHRGMPEVCIFFAILDRAPSYAATLHLIDAGVDTGPVVAQSSFPISPQDTFASVMRRSLENCASVFDANAESVASGAWRVRETDRSASRLHNYKMLPEAGSRRGEESFARAADLGAYAAFFPRLAEFVRGPDRGA